MKFRIGFLVAVAFCAVIFFASNKVEADHQWGNYHWASTSNPDNLLLGNNLSSQWYPSFVQSISDWNASTVIGVSETAGGTRPRQCRITAGRIEVCNDSYGNTGWLGIAGISVSGTHITGAYVKLNDTYYNNPPYNTAPWRNFVMCQEIGHAFGLDHQDEAFNNTNFGTCMDYTNDPVGPPNNEHPDGHDYQQLELIYNHTDGGGGDPTPTPSPTPCRGRGCNGNGADIDFGDSREWGQVVERDDSGRPILYVRNLGNGKKHFTHVFPVPE
ncbi:MAG: hypothetical protein OEM82_08155 [Acidobacteriota bacterium]|nr:hypothetical protein [Acidobacteriota bacterium]MDH3529489.1 hypothetical protein [Acidobacteriota bacterium]